MCLAIPGQVLSIAGDDPLMRTGRVDFGGVVKEINLAYVPEARVGDYVLVHVGFAIAVIDEAEAERVFEHLARDRRARGRARTARHEVPRRISRPRRGAAVRRRHRPRPVTRPWTLMEVCGGQTHAIVRFGIDASAAAGHHAGPRAGLPGLRDAGRL